MKIRNEDYTANNVSDLLNNTKPSKTKFTTNFFDSLNKSTKKYEGKTEHLTESPTKHSLKNATAIDLNNVSDKGYKTFSEFEKFLKNNPTEESFNSLIDSIKDIILAKDNSTNIEDIEVLDELDKDKMLDEILSLISSYNNLNAVNMPTMSNENLVFMPDINLSTNSISVYDSNLHIDSNSLSNTEFDIAELGDIIDSTENEFLNLLDSFSADDSTFEESKSIITNLIKLSKENLKSSIETTDTLSKKEDINTNLNNLITSSMSIKGQNIVSESAKSENPVVRQVIQSIQSQLSKESLNSKTVELRLKLFPSNLGSISVVIEKEDGSLNIKILSDNPEVRSLFVDSIQDLKLELAKGNANNHVNIDISNNNQGEQKQGNRPQNTESYISGDDYIEDISIKITSNNTILDKILDIKI